MNKRYSIIFTITAAAVLVSSIAYASKKKLQSKSGPRPPDMSEVDLTSNLLDQSGVYKTKALKTGDNKKTNDEALNDLTMAFKPNQLDKKTDR